MADMSKEPESSLQQPAGGRGIYEFGTNSHQKEYPKDHFHEDKEPYHEGKAHSHNRLDKEDSRSIKNKLAAEEQRHEAPDSKEVQELKKSPTLPAEMHGNKPSKGARIDAEIKAEEEEELKKMGKYKGMDSNGGNLNAHGHSHGHEHSHGHHGRV